MNFIDYKVYTIDDVSNDILKKNSLGSNQKHIAFVYETSDKAEDAEKARDFIQKIVSAAGLHPKSDIISIALTQKTPCSFSSLKKFDIKHLFVFGRTPVGLGIQAQIEQYKGTDINHCRVFFADNPAVLATDQHKKRLLWNYLKSTFLSK